MESRAREKTFIHYERKSLRPAKRLKEDRKIEGLEASEEASKQASKQEVERARRQARKETSEGPSKLVADGWDMRA